MEENVSDALMMAGAMIIFILALTFSMSSFTTVRTTIDEIFQRDTKVDLVTDESHNYLNYMKAEDDSIRTVGIETVISSIYRLSKENYKVYINTDIELSELEEMTVDNTKYFSRNDNDNSYTYELTIHSNINFEELYGKLKDKGFKEYLGIYQEKSGASSENKPKYRVITYVQKTS